MRVFLDVSRLLLCVLRPAPAGIDRVELAYARNWLAKPSGCTFVVQNAWGRLAAVPHRQISQLIGMIEAFWEAGPQNRRAIKDARRLVVAIHAGLLLGIGRRALRRDIANAGRGIYLLVSHLSLENPGRIARLRRQGLAFVPMVHDLIPTTHPEYARPQQVGRHHRRITTTASLADAVIVNSAATAEALRSHLQQLGISGQATPPIVVARLGVVPARVMMPPPVPDTDAPPYFVALGTIEPRKNHLLLLNLWREMAARFGDKAPRLLVIGRRGWENENILDMLDRCSGLSGLVQETGPLPDAEVTRLLAGARALLFPSFAEGYGLPLAEALALGTPAICSDLPALREVGWTVPEFLDPMDGAAWREAVLHYAQAQSPRREAQLSRLRHWQAPGWDSHFATVEALLAQVVAQPSNPPLTAKAPPRAGGGALMAEPALAGSVPAAPAE